VPITYVVRVVFATIWFCTHSIWHVASTLVVEWFDACFTRWTSHGEEDDGMSDEEVGHVDPEEEGMEHQESRHDEESNGHEEARADEQSDGHEEAEADMTIIGGKLAEMI
jgi:hypothetical protein